jgi:putative ABC transport system permease protein
MAMLNKLRLRLRALFFKSKMEDELQAELQFHLEREIEENIVRGMTPEEARYAALRSFGGVEQMKEESRDERGIRCLEELWHDLRYGMRVLLKHRGFTVVAALTLAFGIGVNTAMFSAVNTLLLQPLPYPDANRLVRVYRTSLQSQGSQHSLPDFDDMVAQSSEFESLAAYSWWTCSLAEPG